MTPIPRQSLTSRARLGGAFQQTKQGGDTPRAPLHAYRPSEAVRPPDPESLRVSVPGLPEPLHRPRRGEGGSGRREWKWSQRAAFSGPRAVAWLLSRRPPEGPPSPWSGVPRAGRALRRAGEAGIRLQREEELPEPWPERPPGAWL